MKATLQRANDGLGQKIKGTSIHILIYVIFRYLDNISGITVPLKEKDTNKINVFLNVWPALRVP